MAFGATNEPGTCLWCGRKLRWACDTKYELVPRKHPRCQNPDGAHVDPRVDDRGLCQEERNITRPNGERYVCGYYVETKQRKVASRVRRHAAPGPYGDGFFDTQACAFRFAVALARNGRRLEPKKP